MAEFDRLSERIAWIDLSFVERDRTPRWAIEIGIRCHLAGMSLREVSKHLELFGIKRSHIAIHNWVHKADLQPESGQSPDHVAVDETVIRLNDQNYWLYAAVDPETNELLHTKLEPTTNKVIAHAFFTELREKHDVDDAVFLIDGSLSLKDACQRHGLDFRYERHGNRNSVERVFREVKRRTSSFSNCFSNAKAETADDWLRSFAFAWNQLI